MNTIDILMYTIFTTGTLYAIWLILNIVRFGILSLYHKITDEVSFYKWKKHLRK